MAKKKSQKKNSISKTQSKGNKDQLGCRVGSQANRINEQLSKKPKDAEVISKATGLSVLRVKQHLRWMVHTRKLVKQNKAGQYHLP